MYTASVENGGKSVLERLSAEHQAMLALCTQHIAFCRSPVAPDWEAFDNFRWGYSRQAIQYLTFKDQHVYLNLQKSADPYLQQLEARLRAAQEELYTRIQAHIHDWPHDAMRRDWTGYARAAGALSEHYVRCLKSEERELHSVIKIMERDGPLGKHQPVRNWAREMWSVRDAVIKS